MGTGTGGEVDSCAPCFNEEGETKKKRTMKWSRLELRKERGGVEAQERAKKPKRSWKSVRLQLIGNGFRWRRGEPRTREVELGYSHDRVRVAPEGVERKVEGLELTVEGSPRRVNELVWKVEQLRPYDRYSGRGVVVGVLGKQSGKGPKVERKGGRKRGSQRRSVEGGLQRGLREG